MHATRCSPSLLAFCPACLTCNAYSSPQSEGECWLIWLNKPSSILATAALGYHRTGDTLTLYRCIPVLIYSGYDYQVDCEHL